MISFETSLDGASFTNEEPPTLIRRRPAAMERRAGVRLPIEMDVHVEGAAHRFDATTGDLSSGGIFVATQRVLPLGAHVMLVFTLPNGVALEVLGAVTRHAGGESSPGFGASFFCLEPKVRELLESFCAVREPLYYGGH